MVTIASLLLGWLGWNMHWIRQRHEFLARHVAPQARMNPNDLRLVYQPQPFPFCTLGPKSKTLGHGLHLLGEQDRSSVRMYVREGERLQGDRIEQAARLFPEATIEVYLSGWIIPRRGY